MWEENPVSSIERFVAAQQWEFQRVEENELTCVIDGRLTCYQLNFSWMPAIDTLHLACAFDMKVPEQRRGEVRQLVALINEHLWIGHFDVWKSEGLVMFRHGSLLPGHAAVSDSLSEALITRAVDTCEQYFAAFQFVVWAGKTAEEALRATQFETKGEA